MGHCRSLPQSGPASGLECAAIMVSPPIALEDWPHTHRGVPISEGDARATYVRGWCKKERPWLSAQSIAMLLGFSSAVIHFNRMPTLAVACCRKIPGAPAAAFFDDVACLGAGIPSRPEVRAVQCTLHSLGTPTAPGKSVPRGHSRVGI